MILLLFFLNGCHRFDPPPNIILIVVDDLGVSDVGFMGNTWFETPNMDRLAEGGMIFTQAYAAAAVCSPTRAAILTGKYPARLHLTDWIRPYVWRSGSEDPESYVSEPGNKLLCPHYPLQLDTLEGTFAEWLHNDGYSTKHIGKWHLGGQGYLPVDQGFDSNFGGCDFGQPPSYHAPYDAPWAPGGIPGVLPENRQEYLTDREVQEAVKFIREHKEGPFLLNLWHYAVHTPIQPKASLESYFKQKRTSGREFHPGYAAMIKSVDEGVGKIMKTLKEEGILERTLIVLTSDNGGHTAYTSNAPWRSGKGNPWEGGLRVPQVFFWSEKISPGSTYTEPVSSIDLLPTIGELVGVKPHLYRGLDGISLGPAIQGEANLETRSLFWHFPHYRAYEDVRPYSIIRNGDWKLIRFWEGKVCLYNLEHDPAEQKDVSIEYPEKCRELEKKLDLWLQETDARVPRLNPERVKE